MRQPEDLRFPTKFYDAYIFDMDGTIYLGDELLPGVESLITQLRRRSIPVRYLSNNPTKDPAQYVEKLTRLGLPTHLEEVTNTVVATTNWLVRNHPEAVVFPIAEAPLINALQQAGIRLSEDPTEIDFVLASYDRGFDYRKLQIAFDAIWFQRRARLIATNPDRYCPFPGGRGEPDCAAIIAAIEACTQTRCELVIGKPNPVMLETVVNDLGIPAKQCLMVGDRLGTDIQMAARSGMDCALPLTGDSTWAEALALPESEQPTFIVDRLDQLVPPS